MITQGGDRSTYLLSKDPEVRLSHCCFVLDSNVWIIQASKLIYKIKPSDAATSNSNNNYFSLDLEANDRKKSELDVNTLAPLNKFIKSIKDLCDIYIKSKHIRIVKHKAMTLTI